MVADMVRRGWRPPPLTDDQAERLLDDMRRVNTGRWHARNLELTVLERDVLYRVAEGATTQEIAEATGRGFETIKDTHTRIRAKLGARNAPHAVALGISLGIIGPVE